MSHTRDARIHTMSRAPFRLTRPLSARFLGASPLNAALPAQCAAIASLASALATKSSPASLPRPVKIVSGTRHSSFLNRIKRFWKKAEVKETDGGALYLLVEPGGHKLNSEPDLVAQWDF